ncbi:MAG: RES family NAD+ phosphorylase [Alloacidobacterium sp.]
MGLPRTPENRVWYRLIDRSHLPTALGSAHSKKTPARFNPGPLLDAPDQFATLALADDPIVAQFEVGAVLGTNRPGYHVPHPNLTFVTLNVQVVLREVIDLTEVNAQAAISMTVQELTGDWDGYQIRGMRTPVSHPTGIAPTQELGRALFATGVEGFRAVSAKVPYHKTLIVFPDNLKNGSGSSLTFNEAGIAVHHIP